MTVVSLHKYFSAIDLAVREATTAGQPRWGAMAALVGNIIAELKNSCCLCYADRAGLPGPRERDHIAE